MKLLRALEGHVWTIGPTAATRVWPKRAPVGISWSDVTADGRALGGRLRVREDDATQTLVVLIHGLGGDPDSRYICTAARIVERMGFSCLRLSAGGGRDLYHAGYTEDIHCALRLPAMRRFARVLLMGYSLGGHMALKAATEERLDPRICAVAALCPPVDLKVGQLAFDSPGRVVYRRHILGGLKEVYTAAARHRDLPTPLDRILATTTIRDFDALTVVPEFGFADPEDYYEKVSVARRLHRLTIPGLLVMSPWDPVVDFESAVRAAAGVSQLTFCALDRGGHVYFPRTVGLSAQLVEPRGRFERLESQVVRWLARHA